MSINRKLVMEEWDFSQDPDNDLLRFEHRSTGAQFDIKEVNNGESELVADRLDITDVVFDNIDLLDDDTLSFGDDKDIEMLFDGSDFIVRDQNDTTLQTWDVSTGDITFNQIGGSPSFGGHDHSEGGMSTVPNAGLTNSSISLTGGNAIDAIGSISLGGSATVAVSTDGIQTDELDLSISPTWTGVHNFEPADTVPIEVRNTDATVAGNQTKIGYVGDNGVGNRTVYARAGVELSTVTDGAEDGKFIWEVISGGTLTKRAELDNQGNLNIEGTLTESTTL